jgi:ABC-type transport system involved in cytochrome c biogenesis ATPase subunit
MAKTKKWIQNAIQNPGSLTETAKRAHMSLTAFINKPPKNISATTQRRINLAKTLRNMHK